MTNFFPGAKIIDTVINDDTKIKDIQDLKYDPRALKLAKEIAFHIEQEYNHEVINEIFKKLHFDILQKEYGEGVIDQLQKIIFKIIFKELGK